MAEVKGQLARHPEHRLQVEKIALGPSDGFGHTPMYIFDRSGERWVAELEDLELFVLVHILDKKTRHLRGTENRQSLESEAREKYPDVFDSSEKNYRVLY